jgi:hypothetical protein
MKTEDDFLNIQKETMEILGFWDETYKASLIRVLESNYKRDIIKVWCISDLVMNGEKVLIKWNKRHAPLSEDEMIKRYGV